MTRHRVLIAVGFVALSLAACDAVTRAVDQASETASPQPSEAPSAPLVASGEPQPLALSTDANLQGLAGVVRVDPIADQNAKLFGAAGGDPAMNGLQTYFAVFLSPAEGWAIYPVGDVLDYRILGAAPGRLELEIDESTLDPATGTIGSRTRKVIVQWTAGAEGTPPTAVTVTPAE